VRETFIKLRGVAGLDRGSGPSPRIHDLRHGFAVQTLLDWHRAGVDVAARLPLLSAWLGHRHPASTYYYLQAAPELLALAAERLPELAARS
jgi:integrase/recombinase XerD